MAIHLSPSKINTYTKCPYLAYWQYVKGYTSEDTFALRIGSALHECLADFYTTGNKDNKALYDLYNKEQAIEEISQYKTSQFKVLRESLDQFYSENLYKPILVEEKFEVEIGEFEGEPIILNGIIDLFTESRVIVDHKTTSERYAEDLDWQRQAVPYSIAIEKIFGEKPLCFELNVFNKMKKDRQRIPIGITQEDIDAFYNTVQNVCRLIKYPLIPIEQDLKTCSFCGEKHFLIPNII